jgi:hypothetical protein
MLRGNIFSRLNVLNAFGRLQTWIDGRARIPALRWYPVAWDTSFERMKLERQELRIARGMEETGSLISELTNVRMTAAGRSRVRVGADGCVQHDDLVIVLALACWRAKRGQNGFGTRRLTGILGGDHLIAKMAATPLPL